MKLIQKTIYNELIINKSRFITSIYRVNNIDEVDLILSSVRKKHYDANHNCYAYIIGNNQDIQKCSDDGEPAKTAGFPMLEVLKKNDFTNILAITTRYFGGVMLGAGGLIRAYSQSVSETIKNAVIFTHETLKIYDLTVDYSNYNALINSNIVFDIISSDFSDNVKLTIGINICDADTTIKSISDLTNARALVSYIKEEIIEVKNNPTPK